MRHKADSLTGFSVTVLRFFCKNVVNAWELWNKNGVKEKKLQEINLNGGVC